MQQAYRMAAALLGWFALILQYALIVNTRLTAILSPPRSASSAISPCCRTSSSRSLKFRSAFVWLLFPLAYAVLSLIHGALTGFYPHPFIDETKLGYDKVLSHYRPQGSA
jgi:hypothetical protein